MDKKTLTFISLGVLGVLGFLVWLFVESSKPLPGEKIADLGRKHVPGGTKVEYNSNPPTSGDHYADWIRSGVYESPKEDGYLVHSLEHGYVIMHYRCQVAGDRLQSTVNQATESGEASPSGQVDTQSQCEERKTQLTKIYEKKGKRKLIVVPRASLDTNFALTAWTYIDKFDSFDQSRIEKFIDAHLNQGPEKTME